MDSHDYHEELQKKIRHPFVEKVLVHNLLYAFHKYDKYNALTKTDIEKVERKLDTDGNRAAANLLLDFLCHYDQWFPHLIEVLNDRNVRLNRLAEDLEEIKAKLDEKWCPQEPVTIPKNCVLPASPPSTITQKDKVKSDFNLPRNFRNLSLGERDKTEDSPVDILHGQEIIGADSDVSGSTSSDKASSRTVRKNDECSTSNPGNTTVCDCHRNSTDDPPPTEYAPPIPPPAPQGKEKRSKVNHGPEYDFSYQETKKQMESWPGWHEHLTMEEAHDKMTSLLSKDGYYFLWYWEEKKRPAVCVTYKGERMPFLIHKKPDRKSKKAAYFFINKKQKRSPTLHDLLEYHMENGILDEYEGQSQSIISLKHPV